MPAHQLGQVAEDQHAWKWLMSYKSVSSWLSRYDVERALDENGGLATFDDFLPTFVARAILHFVEQIPENQWVETAAEENAADNNIDHCFWSTKHAPDLANVFRVFALLKADSLHTFSAARYNCSHHIAPHDDRAYVPVAMAGGGTVLCSRRVALIYYLTPGWQREWGGLLEDCEGGAVHVPRFNRALLFRVPRYHTVTRVTTDAPRYSIFGWFLTPGRAYELHGAGAHDARAHAHAQRGGRALQPVVAPPAPAAHTPLQPRQHLHRPPDSAGRKHLLQLRGARQRSRGVCKRQQAGCICARTSLSVWVCSSRHVRRTIAHTVLASSSALKKRARRPILRYVTLRTGMSNDTHGCGAGACGG